MSNNKIEEIFEDFLVRKPLFKDKSALQANYTPSTIPHREDQIKLIAQILAPSLRMNKPSNIFLYGKTGTGKTLSVLYTVQNLKKIAEKENIPLKILYVNCKLKKIADTEYRLIAQLAKDLGKAIPVTGLPTSEVYQIFYDALEKENQLLVVVLDEIDQLVKKVGDEILYNLTRINSELKKSQLSIIGISNDLIFADNLDPRVKSSLSEEEIIFPPYNALQIKDILLSRSSSAFEEGVLCEGVIEKCAAYTAREHGDARRALELLRVAGELAEREGKEKVLLQHLDSAEEKIEKERVIDIIIAQPKQFQVTLYSIIAISEKNSNLSVTGEIYDLYKGLCQKTGLRPLTQRRVSDIISELDMLGLINACVTSKGRYGRTREMSLAIPPALVPKIKDIIEKDLDLK